MKKSEKKAKTPERAPGLSSWKRILDFGRPLAIEALEERVVPAVADLTSGQYFAFITSTSSIGIIGFVADGTDSADARLHIDFTAGAGTTPDTINSISLADVDDTPDTPDVFNFRIFTNFGASQAGASGLIFNDSPTAGGTGTPLDTGDVATVTIGTGFTYTDEVPGADADTDVLLNIPGDGTVLFALGTTSKGAGIDITELLTAATTSSITSVGFTSSAATVSISGDVPVGGVPIPGITVLAPAPATDVGNLGTVAVDGAIGSMNVAADINSVSAGGEITGTVTGGAIVGALSVTDVDGSATFTVGTGVGDTDTAAITITGFGETTQDVDVTLTDGTGGDDDASFSSSGALGTLGTGGSVTSANADITVTIANTAGNASVGTVTTVGAGNDIVSLTASGTIGTVTSAGDIDTVSAGGEITGTITGAVIIGALTVTDVDGSAAFTVGTGLADTDTAAITITGFGETTQDVDVTLTDGTGGDDDVSFSSSGTLGQLGTGGNVTTAGSGTDITVSIANTASNATVGSITNTGAGAGSEILAVTVLGSIAGSITTVNGNIGNISATNIGNTTNGDDSITAGGTNSTIGTITATTGAIDLGTTGDITSAGGIGAISAGTTIAVDDINGNSDGDTTGTGLTAGITAGTTLTFDLISTDDGADATPTGPGIGNISAGGTITGTTGITSGGNLGNIGAGGTTGNLTIAFILADGSIGNLSAANNITATTIAASNAFGTSGTDGTVGTITATGSITLGGNIQAAEGIGAINAGTTLTVAGIINANTDNDASGTGLTAGITAGGNLVIGTVTTDDTGTAAAGPDIGNIASTGGDVTITTLTSGGDLTTVSAGGTDGDITITTMIVEGDADGVIASGTGTVSATISIGTATVGSPIFTVVSTAPGQTSLTTYTIDATGAFTSARVDFDINSGTSGTTPDVALTGVTGTDNTTTLSITTTGTGAAGNVLVDLLGIDVDPTPAALGTFPTLSIAGTREANIQAIRVEGNLGASADGGARAGTGGIIDFDLHGVAANNVGDINSITLEGSIAGASEIDAESIQQISFAPNAAPVVTTTGAAPDIHVTFSFPPAANTLTLHLAEPLPVTPSQQITLTTTDGTAAFFFTKNADRPFADSIFLSDTVADARSVTATIDTIDPPDDNLPGINFVIGTVTLSGGPGIILEATQSVARIVGSGEDEAGDVDADGITGEEFVRSLEVQGSIGTIQITDINLNNNTRASLGRAFAGFDIGTPGAVGLAEAITGASFNPAANGLLDILTATGALIPSSSGPDFIIGTADDVNPGAASIGVILVDGSLGRTFTDGAIAVAATGSLGSQAPAGGPGNPGVAITLNDTGTDTTTPVNNAHLIGGILVGDNLVGNLTVEGHIQSNLIGVGVQKVGDDGIFAGAFGGVNFANGSIATPTGGAITISTDNFNSGDIGELGEADRIVVANDASLTATAGDDFFMDVQAFTGSIDGALAALGRLGALGDGAALFTGNVLAGLDINANISAGLDTTGAVVDTATDGDILLSTIQSGQRGSGSINGSAQALDDIGVSTIGGVLTVAAVTIDAGTGRGGALRGSIRAGVGTTNEASNGLDDDGDGVVDEADEAGGLIRNTIISADDEISSDEISATNSIGFEVTPGTQGNNVTITAGGDITASIHAGPSDLVVNDEGEVISGTAGPRGDIQDVTITSTRGSILGGVVAGRRIGNSIFTALAPGATIDSFFAGGAMGGAAPVAGGLGGPVTINASSSVGNITVLGLGDGLDNDGDGFIDEGDERGLLSGTTITTLAGQNGQVGDITVSNITADVADIRIISDFFGNITVGEFGQPIDEVVLPGFPPGANNDISTTGAGGDILFQARTGGFGDIFVASDIVTDTLILGAGTTINFVAAGDGFGQVAIGNNLSGDSNFVSTLGGGMLGLFVGDNITGGVDINLDGILVDVEDPLLGLAFGSVLVGGSSLIAGVTPGISGTVNIVAASMGDVVVGLDGPGNIDPAGGVINIQARASQGSIGNVTVRNAIGDITTPFGGVVNITSVDGSIGNVVAGSLGPSPFFGPVNITAAEGIGDVVAVEGSILANVTLQVTRNVNFAGQATQIGDVIAHGNLAVTIVSFDGNLGDLVSLNGTVILNGIGEIGGNVGDIFASEGIIGPLRTENGSIGLDGSIGTDDLSLNNTQALTSTDALGRTRQEGAPEDGITSELGNIAAFFRAGNSIGRVEAGGNVSGAFIAQGGDIVSIESLGGDIGGPTAGSDGFDNDGDGMVDESATDGIDNDFDGLTDEADEAADEAGATIFAGGSIGSFAGAIDGVDNDGDGEVDEADEATGVRAENFIHDNVTITAGGRIGVVEARIIGFSQVTTLRRDLINNDTDGQLDDNDILILDNDGIFDFSNDRLVFEDTNGDGIVTINPTVSGFLRSAPIDQTDNDGDGLIDEADENFLADGFLSVGEVNIILQSALGATVTGPTDLVTDIDDVFVIDIDGDGVFSFGNDEILIGDGVRPGGVANGIVSLSAAMSAFLADNPTVLDAEVFGNISAAEMRAIIASTATITDPRQFGEVRVRDVDDIIDIPNAIGGGVLFIIAEGADDGDIPAIGRIRATTDITTDVFVDATNGGIGSIEAGGVLGAVSSDTEEGLAGVRQGAGNNLAQAEFHAATNIGTIRAGEGITNLEITVESAGGIDLSLINNGEDDDGDGQIDEVDEAFLGSDQGVGLEGGIIANTGDISNVEINTGGSIGHTFAATGSIRNVSFRSAGDTVLGAIGHISAFDDISNSEFRSAGLIGDVRTSLGDINNVTLRAGSEISSVNAVQGEILNIDLRSGAGVPGGIHAFGDITGRVFVAGPIGGLDGEQIVSDFGTVNVETALFLVSGSNFTTAINGVQTTFSLTSSGETEALIRTDNGVNVRVDESTADTVLSISTLGSGLLTINSLTVSGDFGGLQANGGGAPAHVNINTATVTGDITGNFLVRGFLNNLDAGSITGQVQNVVSDGQTFNFDVGGTAESISVDGGRARVNIGDDIEDSPDLQQNVGQVDAADITVVGLSQGEDTLTVNSTVSLDDVTGSIASTLILTTTDDIVGNVTVSADEVEVEAGGDITENATIKVTGGTLKVTAGGNIETENITATGGILSIKAGGTLPSTTQALRPGDAPLVFTNDEGNTQEINLRGSRGVVAEVTTSFGRVTEIEVSGRGTLVLSSTLRGAPGEEADVGEINVVPGDRINIRSIDVHGDLGSLNANDIRSVRVDGDVGKIQSLQDVRDVRVGGGINLINATRDVRNVVAGDEGIDRIVAGRHVINVVTPGQIKVLTAGTAVINVASTGQFEEFLAGGRVKNVIGRPNRLR